MSIDVVLLLVHFFSYGFMLYVNQRKSVVVTTGIDRVIFVGQVTIVTLVSTFLTVTIFVILYPQNIEINSAERVISVLVGYNSLTLCLLFLVGGMFYVLSVLRLKSQNILPTYVFLPIYKSSIVIAVIAGYIYFDEKNGIVNLLASALALFVIFEFWRDKNNQNTSKYSGGVLLAFVCALLASLTQLVSKVLLSGGETLVPIDQVSPFSLVLGSNLFNLVICLLTIMYLNRKRLVEIFMLKGMSIYSGILNFITFLTLNMYLVHGDLSVAYPVSALSILLPTLIMQIKNEEKRPRKKQMVLYLMSLCIIIVLIS